MQKTECTCFQRDDFREGFKISKHFKIKKYFYIESLIHAGKSQKPNKATEKWPSGKKYFFGMFKIAKNSSDPGSIPYCGII